MLNPTAKKPQCRHLGGGPRGYLVRPTDVRATSRLHPASLLRSPLPARQSADPPAENNKFRDEKSNRREERRRAPSQNAWPVKNYVGRRAASLATPGWTWLYRQRC